ncbi:Polyphosphate kinase 2 (PPK2) [Stieleria maiorica]|uniref:Polyphosphate kinase 2 (PPK2) n=1 Tax=Stieleria maiorica TaxID=2795974 RepID=A0A5B9MPS6_9BACT|nr:hypothetical protein [Stieleria maiorica]QEG01755.1 Polyphosphate kinase 2 (PPK2) [Stieleria maiorica]
MSTKPAKPSKNGTKNAKSKSKKKTKRRNRLVAEGDTSPSLTPQELEDFEVDRSVAAALQSKISAVRDIIETTPPHDVHTLAKTLDVIIDGASPEDATVLRNALFKKSHPSAGGRRRSSPDDQLSSGWRDGAFPYRNLMSRKTYEKQKYQLLVELLKLQAWVKESKEKVVILFEGCDAAGKGGTIKRFMEHLSPRGAQFEWTRRLVHYAKPSDVQVTPAGEDAMPHGANDTLLY